jgi:hypothetical protein
MAESHIVSALVRKHSEIAGRLLEAERQMAGIHDNLAHLDAVLRMFAPDLDPSTIKSRKARTRPHSFAKGGWPD